MISGKIMGKRVSQEMCKNVHSSVDFFLFFKRKSSNDTNVHPQEAGYTGQMTDKNGRVYSSET